MRRRDTWLGFGRPGAQLLLDLSRHGETAGLLLGEEQLVADGDLEDTPGAAHELGLDAELPLEIRRQTGGAGIVVSHPAVFDPHVGHGGSSFCWTILRQAIRLSPEPLEGSLLQLLDQRWIRLLKRGMKVLGAMFGYYKCASGGKRDKEQTFSWISRRARSTIEIVQPSLYLGNRTRWGREVKKVSRSALVKALRHTTVGNCPSSEAASGAAAINLMGLS
jgi:hypothetical protein